MAARRFDDFESGVDEFIDSQNGSGTLPNLTNKLERRRRIEEIDEERRLREELGDY